MVDILQYTKHFVKCKCGREILIEIFHNGIPHIAHITVTCKECVNTKDSDDFKKRYPKDYKELAGWINEN